MTYETFSDFIVDLSKLARDDIPAFSTIKDLFDFIDMKKDGIIDINEWTQTFNQLPVYLVINLYMTSYHIRF